MGKKKGKKKKGVVSGTIAGAAAKAKDTSKYRELLACADSANQAALGITTTIDSTLKASGPKATAAPEVQLSLPPGSLRATAIPGIQLGKQPENLQELLSKVESDVKFGAGLSGKSPSQKMLLETIGETIEAASAFRDTLEGSAIASAPDSESLIEKIAKIIANPTSGVAIELKPDQIQPVIDRTDPSTIINSLYIELINTVASSIDHKMTVTACSQLLRKIQDEISLTRVDPRLLQDVTKVTKAMNGTIKDLSAALRSEIEESKSKTGEIESLRDRLASTQSESLITESDNAEIKKRLEAKIRDLNKELKAIKKENSAAKDAEIKTLRAELAESTREYVRKEAEIASLRSKLEAATKANEDKEGSISSLRTEIGTAKRLGGKKDAQISSLKAKLKAATEASAKKPVKTEAISVETQTEQTDHEIKIAELKKVNAELREKFAEAARNLGASIQYLTGQAASMTLLAHREQTGQPSAITAPEQVVAHGGKPSVESKKGR